LSVRVVSECRRKCALVDAIVEGYLVIVGRGIVIVIPFVAAAVVFTFRTRVSIVLVRAAVAAATLRFRSHRRPGHIILLCWDLVWC